MLLTRLDRELYCHRSITPCILSSLALLTHSLAVLRAVNVSGSIISIHIMQKIDSTDTARWELQKHIAHLPLLLRYMTTALCRYQICTGAFWLQVGPGFSCARDQEHWLLGSLYHCRRLLCTARTKQGAFMSYKDDHRKLNFLFMAEERSLHHPSSLLCSWTSRYCGILGHLPWNSIQSMIKYDLLPKQSLFVEWLPAGHGYCVFMWVYRQQTQGLLDSCP